MAKTYTVTSKQMEKEGQALKVWEYVKAHSGATTADVVKGLKSVKPNNTKWWVAQLRVGGWLKATSEKKATAKAPAKAKRPEKKSKELKRPEKSAKNLKATIDATEKIQAAEPTKAA